MEKRGNYNAGGVGGGWGFFPGALKMKGGAFALT